MAKRAEQTTGATPSDDRERLSIELSQLGSATLGESGARRMHPRIRPVWSGAAVAAPAYPVQCAAGDNLAVHVAVTRAPRGGVLAVDVGSTEARGYWGEVLTTAAEAAALAGLVIDGGVRDVDALEEHRFPVFSTMVALQGASKVSAGTAGMPAKVGGVDVRAGDWVVCDVDGVVVVPGGELEQVLVAGRARRDKEAGMFELLRAGSTTIELLGLDASVITGPDRTH